ncbi:MAG: alpha-amylase family glycosyl hydrolase [Fusobacteriota bacterium]
MKKFLLVLILILSFTGCFKNEEEPKEVMATGKVENGKFIVRSNVIMDGVELIINGDINSDEIAEGNEIIKMINKNETETNIYLAKNDSKIIKGDELFSIDVDSEIDFKVENIVNLESSQNIQKRASTDILLGDFNNDNTVDLLDLNTFANNFDTIDTDSDYNIIYDIAPAEKGIDFWGDIYSKVSPDGKVDLLDFVIFARNFGKSTPGIFDLEDINILYNGGNLPSSIEIGESIDLEAQGILTDGSTENIDANWSVNDSTVATIDNSGLLTGVSAGIVNITAEVDGISKVINMNVVEGFTDGIKVHAKYSHIWAWQGETNLFDAWPGEEMTSEGTEWYTYTLSGINTVGIIFSDNGGSKTGELILEGAGEYWYDGTWHTSDPDIDTEAPVASLDPNPGKQDGNILLYETSILETKMIIEDNQDSNPMAYYTTDGSTPTTGSAAYSTGEIITINEDVTLKILTLDNENNQDIITYQIKLNEDVTGPVISSTPEPMRYEVAQDVNLFVTDNKDSSPEVYYTVDGTEPLPETGYLYNGETITISENTKINVLAIDNSGNETQSEFRYYIGEAPERTDFREETIYFLMTTRFYNGDPNNDVYCWADEQAGNVENNDPAWRGDFKGLADKLDYIKALGFSAIWITPVVKNASGYDYHGYHAVDFTEVDPRYESTGFSYQDLIDAVHARDMKIIQDVVFNHTSNFGEENLYPLFEKDSNGDYISLDSPDGMIANDILEASAIATQQDSYGNLLPDQQYPARISAMKEDDMDTEEIYHHEKSLQWEGYSVQTGQIAGDCVDLNTENPDVTQYLRDAYNQYIDMGVDGFRIDTVKHISRLTFNEEFIPQFRERGGENFFMFGEVAARYRDVWNSGIPAISVPFYTWKESQTYPWGDKVTNKSSVEQHWADNSSVDNEPTSDNHYLNGNEYHTPDWSMRSGMDQIDFPMHWSFRTAGEAFNTAVGGDQYYSDATFNVTYVDSHDYAPDQAPEGQRFSEPQDVWAENLSLMFTFRGIPTLYYGSEIEFKKGATIDKGPNITLEESGRAYFGDHMEGSVDVSDFGKYSNASGEMANTLSHPLAQHIRKLNIIRRAIPALQKGQYSVSDISGGLSYKRRYTDEQTDSFALVTVSGGATFNNIPNGTYVDAVTGDEISVTGGSATIDLSGKGNLRVYVLNTSKTPAPGKLIETGLYLK